jgi:hypothetical protein
LSKSGRTCAAGKLDRALFVAAGGMNSAANREELGRACGKYLLATRMATVAEVKHEVLSQPGRTTCRPRR